MVALQVAIDYLDSLGELRADDPLARRAAAARGPLTGTPRRALGRDPYLGELVAAYRAALARCPPTPPSPPRSSARVARCGEGQAHTHAAEHGDRAALEAWARALDAPAVYRWWEVAAGASSSVAAHALIAAAADPRTRAERRS